MRRQSAMMCLAAGALAIVGCPSRTPAPHPPASLVILSSERSSGHVALRRPAVWIEDGRPGLFFAPAQPGQEPLALAFVVVVRLPGSLMTFEGELSPVAEIVSGGEATLTKGGVKIKTEGQAFELAHALRYGQRDGVLIDEVLEVQGQRRNPDKGRVFLVDLSRHPAHIEQIDFDLTGPRVEAKSEAEVKRQALEWLARLEEGSEPTREFVRRK